MSPEKTVLEVPPSACSPWVERGSGCLWVIHHRHHTSAEPQNGIKRIAKQLGQKQSTEGGFNLFLALPEQF